MTTAATAPAATPDPAANASKSRSGRAAGSKKPGTSHRVGQKPADGSASPFTAILQILAGIAPSTPGSPKARSGASATAGPSVDPKTASPSPAAGKSGAVTPQPGQSAVPVGVDNLHKVELAATTVPLPWRPPMAGVLAISSSPTSGLDGIVPSEVDPMSIDRTLQVVDRGAANGASSSFLGGYAVGPGPTQPGNAGPAAAAVPVTVSQQVAQVVADSGRLGMSGAVVVQLNPPALGRVTIRISAADGQHVRVHLRVEHAAVRDALAADWGQVDTALRAHGLSPDGMSIDVGAFADPGRFSADVSAGSQHRADGQGSASAAAGPPPSVDGPADVAASAPGPEADRASRDLASRTGRLLDYKL